MPVENAGPATSFVVEPGRAVAKRPSGPRLVLRQAELGLSGQHRSLPRRCVRVPLDAIVPVGAGRAPGSPSAPRVTSAVEGPRLPAPPSTPRPARSRAALVVREAVTVVLFVATLAATYYLGRTHGFQNVIIVPEPWNSHASLG